ncbi:MAG: type IX secretion system outer membrane channel protein PorV [Chitinophagaceae bacterium]|nr:MAG: type IX secretion system outer membrane channel protein PorV [Chitinophagaceae bacterium]
MNSTASKLTACLLIMSGLSPALKAQDQPINVVTTAVPFLRISPDARAGGMGELGLATSPDAASGFWNMGKVAFNQSKGGISATYTPWLKQLVNDVYLLSASGYYKLDENQAITGGIRYFSLGNIQFTDQNGNLTGNGKPREFGLDFGYSRKLSEKLGLGVSLRYINSDLASGAASGGNTYKVGSTVAGDIGLYYDGKSEAGDGFTFGAALSNLGGKIAYTDNADQRDFIPANFGIGATWNKAFDEQNKITFGVDLNKLLVPALESNDPAAIADYRSKGVVSSWGSSFSDFPGQANASLGAEYWYNNQFALRAGYFFEDKNKGNRKYFTAGIGLKYNVFGLNFSYLAPSGSGTTRNPLSNTVRFSVLFDLDGGSSAGE